MDVFAAADVGAFVQERGGRLYAWIDRTRCCGGAMTFLRTSTETPTSDRAFREIAHDGFRLFVDLGPYDAPDELGLVLKAWRHKRVEAFWNGCAVVEFGMQALAQNGKIAGHVKASSGGPDVDA